MLFDDTIKGILTSRLEKLEKHFDSDVLFYYGEIKGAYTKHFRNYIEKLRASGRKQRLTVILNSPGGEAEAAEKLVDIIRFHYAELYFVVPDYAMSSATIFCMSGNKIFMDYSSSLGPIDPQVDTGKGFVPALGYLDQVEKLLDKAKSGILTHAEFLILQNQDLAMLSRYEQAKNLTITLLKKWLVQYKFSDWNTHGTSPDKLGQPVTVAEKQERAEDVATKLGNNKHWHSHGRMIGIDTLKTYLRLKIEDYSGDKILRGLVRDYNDLVLDYVLIRQYPMFLHSRNDA
jgi:membrane-bound ClpP family serine protease